MLPRLYAKSLQTGFGQVTATNRFFCIEKNFSEMTRSVRFWSFSVLLSLNYTRSQVDCMLTVQTGFGQVTAKKPVFYGKKFCLKTRFLVGFSQRFFFCVFHNTGFHGDSSWIPGVS